MFILNPQPSKSNRIIKVTRRQIPAISLKRVGKGLPCDFSITRIHPVFPLTRLGDRRDDVTFMFRTHVREIRERGKERKGGEQLPLEYNAIRRVFQTYRNLYNNMRL